MRREAVAGLALLAILSSNAFALRYMTKEEALRDVFGTEAQITPTVKELDGEKLQKVKNMLGGSLTNDPRVEGNAQKKFTFYVASRGGKEAGVAFVDEEASKWGTMEYLTAMDMTGKVIRVNILSSTDKRSRTVTRRSFLNQFVGKTANDPFKNNSDVSAVSGATISSESAFFAVKKSVVLFNEVYLK